MRWTEHLEFLKNKLQKYIFAFRQLSETLENREIKIAYHAYVQSLLSFGIIAFGGAFKTFLQPLCVIQKSNLKVAFKKRQRYPTDELFSELAINTPDTLEYVYHPAPSRILRFKVKARHDAHIILSEGPSPGECDPVLEVVIGGCSNTKSLIRRDRAKPDKAVINTPNILSDYEFRGFWIYYFGGSIAVGRENEVEPFLNWIDPAPINVGYFGVSTGHGATGEWIIEWIADDQSYYDEPLPNVVPSASGEVAWVPDQEGMVPENGVLGGYDHENLYVCRAKYEGALTPGKTVSSHRVCYVPWGGKEQGKSEYEVLTGSNLQWVPTREKTIPPQAVVGGNTENGETLYICRVQLKEYSTIGKVQPSHSVCYVPYGGLESPYHEYDILVQ